MKINLILAITATLLFGAGLATGKDQEMIAEADLMKMISPSESAQCFADAMESAKTGDPEAQCVVALYYYTGLWRQKDYGAAREWFLKSAYQGYAAAQYNLCMMYYNGEGVEKDLVESYSWLVRAAENDSEYRRGLKGLAKKLSIVQRMKAEKRTREIAGKIK